MNIKRAGAAAVLAMVTLMSGSCSAQDQPPQQIYWVRSPQMAARLARQFHLPILMFVTSDGCYYCRKMKQEVWSNPQIITMVEADFIPLEVSAERDAAFVAALKIRAFPTTLLFSENGKFIDGGAGYLPPNQVAGLLRSGPRSQSASEQVTQNR